jgi:flavin reductase (DIM6/NTAB) family NADH-FMN oxidoreductase RutF
MKKSLGSQTLAYPTPVFIIGSYDTNGQPNLMAVAWGGICNSKPPSIAISLREATHSYPSLIDTKSFTVNIPSVAQVKAADYVGLVSGREVNKFEEAGLTAVRSDIVNAPYIDEFPLTLECKVVHTFKLGLHTQFVGEITDVKADELILDPLTGKPDIEKLQPFCYAPGNQAYYKIGECIGQAFSIGRKDQIQF